MLKALTRDVVFVAKEHGEPAGYVALNAAEATGVTAGSSSSGRTGRGPPRSG